MKRASIVVVATVLASWAAGQDQPKPQPVTRAVRCGSMLRVENGQLQRNVVITIQGDRITDVRKTAPRPRECS